MSDVKYLVQATTQSLRYILVRVETDDKGEESVTELAESYNHDQLCSIRDLVVNEVSVGCAAGRVAGMKLAERTLLAELKKHGYKPPA